MNATGPTTVFRTTAPTANLNLTASSTAATTAGGVHNYNGKIGILSSGTSDPALGLVVNTTGKINIVVTFDIATITISLTVQRKHDGTMSSCSTESVIRMEHLLH